MFFCGLELASDPKGYHGSEIASMDQPHMGLRQEHVRSMLLEQQTSTQAYQSEGLSDIVYRCGAYAQCTT